MSEPYLIIKDAVSKEICELLSDYAKFKASLKKIAYKDGPLAGVHREYGDPLMETLMLKLTPVIEKAVGLELWPTLSFYYTYKNGNQLKPHMDRDSCQYVAGLCIGADEDFKKTGNTWPLILKINNEAKPISLDYGDLLIFKAHQIEHWRETFTGNWFVSAIFGYVEKSGPYSFQKYDQRKMLGKPHVGMLRWYFGYMKNLIKNKLKLL